LPLPKKYTYLPALPVARLSRLAARFSPLAARFAMLDLEVGKLVNW